MAEAAEKLSFLFVFVRRTETVDLRDIGQGD
jgi:hypothetical protein